MKSTKDYILMTQADLLQELYSANKTRSEFLEKHKDLEKFEGDIQDEYRQLNNRVANAYSIVRLNEEYLDHDKSRPVDEEYEQYIKDKDAQQSS